MFLISARKIVFEAKIGVDNICMFMYSKYMSKKNYSKSLHVLLTPEQHKKLLNVSKKSGDSIGFIIRESIDKGEYYPKSLAEDVMQIALRESLKLQAHYAQLLNDYDGGKRHIFKSVSEWIAKIQSNL